MARRQEGMPSTVTIQLRPEDVEEMLHLCTDYLEAPPDPMRWVWWRIAQACQAALHASNTRSLVGTSPRSK